MNRLGVKAVEALAREYDSHLRADDSRFHNSVMILHSEGTVLYFENAFAVRVENWHCVFTEHHRFYVYEDDDANVFMRGPRISIPTSNLEVPAHERSTVPPVPPEENK